MKTFAPNDKINYFDQMSKLILYSGHIKETTNDPPSPPFTEYTTNDDF